MHPTVIDLMRSSSQAAIVVVLKNTLSERFFKAIARIQAKSAMEVGAIEKDNNL